MSVLFVATLLLDITTHRIHRPALVRQIKGIVDGTNLLFRVIIKILIANLVNIPSIYFFDILNMGSHRTLIHGQGYFLKINPTRVLPRKSTHQPIPKPQH